MDPFLIGVISGFVPSFSISLIIILLIMQPGNGKRACVVVLGDIGRSPRMQYHSLSLVRHGFDVDFIGYAGSTPHQEVAQNPKITRHHLREPPALLNRMPRLIVYILKTIWQVVTLTLMMCWVKKPSHILLQNPPAIPTLFVASLVAFIRRSHLVVDWHNYGYSILALALGNRHPLVRFSYWYEGFFGRFAASNICVTRAMKEDLQEKWQISASTVYDRPPDIFQETSLSTKHELFMNLAKKYDVFKNRDSNMDEDSSTEKTCFTQRDKAGRVSLLVDRPALLISSTSWTEDEDFSILLKALERYESDAKKSVNFPDLVCIITGKGPQKEYYQKQIKEKNMKHVQFCLPWLEAEEYPKLLGSADLGVCLHMSSSGLDLPMKVVDMFGCGLPVCAINFKCLNELVRHGENGLVFDDQEQLCSQIQELLQNFPNEQSHLQTFRSNLKAFQNSRWNDNWNRTVAPLFAPRREEEKNGEDYHDKDK